MIICDRCNAGGIQEEAREVLTSRVDDTMIHLCTKCRDDVLHFVREAPKKKRSILSLGRKKESA